VFIVFRLVRLLVSLAVILAVLGVIAYVVGRPFVERVAARSIEDRLGTPVDVTIATDLSPGVVRGDLGEVTVEADEFERDGLRLVGARAVYRGVDVEVSDLLTGDVRLHYSRVAFQGALTEGALLAYLRPLLDDRGVPASSLRVAIGTGKATLSIGSQQATMRARIQGRSSIRLVPLSGSAMVMQALDDPIVLGPLPDGVRLTGIALRPGRATITGGGGAGSLKA
jgi:hypothetical protein